MNYLCEDILIEILARLPVKPLLRFMAVCRLWKSIITSPKFIRLQQSSNQRRTKLLVHTDQQCHALVEDDNRFETTDCPYKHCFVGSDNGLVCIRTPDPNNRLEEGGIPSRIIFWNPSIRKHAVIPPTNDPAGEPVRLLEGFGATFSGGDDFKYVRIVGSPQAPEVEIYSWRTGAWRRKNLDCNLFSCKVLYPTCVSLRGTLHWTVFDLRISNLINSICTFDLEDEVFDRENNNMLLPECISSVRLFHVAAFVIYESQLAVIANEVGLDCSTVWVMQVYGDVNSWTKLCRVDSCVWSMVYLLKNGDELLLGLRKIVGLTYPPKLVKCDPKTGKETNINFGGLSEICGFTTYHKESLVFFLTHDHRVIADHEVLSGMLH